MREEAFRAYLSRFLGKRSVGCYLSNGRRVERVLGTRLEDIHPDPAQFERIAVALRADGAAAGSVADCLTATRRYFAFMQSEQASPDGRGRAVRIASPRIMESDPTELEDRSVADLVSLCSKVLEELRRRGLSRSGNGPVGDFAEALFARAFGWRLAGNSEKGIDATTAGGRTVQIKARRITGVGGARHLGAIRSIETGSFDILAVVFFDAAMTVREAYLIPHALVAERARYVRHTNSWRLVLPRSVGAVAGVEDVTSNVQAAAAGC